MSSIPGISAAEVADLAALSLHTTSDLLRTDRAALARRLPGLTLDRVKGWQAFAELCEIRDITADAAAAIRAAGADGVEEFAGWTLARARQVLAGTGDETILDWMKDALRLTQTGVLNGTVRLKDGTPVEGAAVTVAGRAAATDARGRFRVTRLPLDRKATVTIHHSELGWKLVRSVPVARSSALVGQSFVLSGRPARPKVLSELRGDRLPPLGGAPIAARVEPGAPDPTDILMVIDRYANGDARAASRFLDFEEGRFLRRVYRIPAADLPAGLQDRDDLEWTGTLWALARYSAAQIARRVRLRALYRSHPHEPATQAEAERFAKALVKALTDPGR
jgi:hypothetical protein